MWVDFGKKRTAKHPDCRPNAATDNTHRTPTPLDAVLRMMELNHVAKELSAG